MGFLAPSRNFAAIIALVGGLSAPALAQQSGFPTFGQVDYVWTQNPQLFENLWQSAQAQTVRIAILGDSQETNPGGEGVDYIPRLDYEMWTRFGNVPETPIEGCSSYGGGAPYADWLLRGACAAPGPSPSRLAANQILPNVQPLAYSTLNGATNINGEYYGELTLLEQNAIDLDPAAAIPSTVNYFNTAGVVKAEIFAATNPSSGEIAYWAQPVDSNIPDYYAPISTSGVLTLGLQSPNFAVLSGSTAALSYGGNAYMALQVAGTDDTALTDIIGVRFFNETYPQGVVFDTFSHGGYQASSFLNAAGNAGAMFQAMNFQAVILHYGANDSGNGVSAQDFQTNIESVMALVRSWIGDPNFPVILIADVYRTGLSPTQQAQFDQYVGAQLAIAQSDSHVMVINSRRLMENLGWSGSSGQSSTFLKDGVHYTPYGAKVLAAAEAAAMMSDILIAGCSTDPNSVALQANLAVTVDLGGATPCTGYGQYNVAQSLTLNQATLDVVLTNGFVPALGQTFKILSWAALTGAFGTLNLPSLSAGLAWDTTKLYTTGSIAVRPSVAPSIHVASSANQSVIAGNPVAPVAFTVAGTGALEVTAVSGNPVLLPASGVLVSSGCGSSALSCSAQLTVASGQTGSSTVTLTVADAYGQAGSATLTITVTKPPAPTIDITSGGKQSLTAGDSLAPVAFTVTGSGALTVTATSSNTTLLPAAGVVLSAGCGSSNHSCSVHLSVASGQTGTSSVTLAASDQYGQTRLANATIDVMPALNSNGGGGALDVLSLLALASLAAIQRRRSALRLYADCPRLQ